MAGNNMSEVFYYKGPENESKASVQEEVDTVIVSSTGAAWCSQHEELNARISALEERFRNADLLQASADLITPVYDKILDAAVSDGLSSFISIGLLPDSRREFRKQYLSNALQALSITTAALNSLLRVYKPSRHEDYYFYNPKTTLTERIELLQSSQSSEYVDLLAQVDKYPALFVETVDSSDLEDDDEGDELVRAA